MLESINGQSMSTPEQLPPAKPINTRSAHNAKLWVVQGIREGRLKNCWNLDIDIVDVHKKDSEEDVGRSYFVPSCLHNSFETRYGYMNDSQHLTLLQNKPAHESDFVSQELHVL